MLTQVEADLRRQDFSDFWDAVAHPDLAVVRAIADDNVDERIDQLIAEYGSVISLYGSGREIDSVIYQWEFAAETAKKLGERATAATLDGLVDALAE